MTETKWAAARSYDGTRFGRVEAVRRLALAFAHGLAEMGYDGSFVGVPEWFDSPGRDIHWPAVGWKVSVWTEAKA